MTRAAPGPADALIRALDGMWGDPDDRDEERVAAEEALRAAGVLDPWPWRRRGVRASVAPEPAGRATLVPDDEAPPLASRTERIPLVMTVLPHHDGLAAQRWWAYDDGATRFEVAALPAGLPPDLLGVPDTVLERIARRHLAAAGGAHPRSPVWAQGESGLRWQAVFRALGSRRPFVHVPHANPVVGDTALAALAAARTRLRGDLVLAGSPAAAAPWRRLGFAVDPHFPFGVDAERLVAPPEAVARARAALGPAPAALYTGRLDADKGLFALLDAVALVRERRPLGLVLAWKGGHPAVARLVRERAAQLGGVRIVEDPPAALYAALHGACVVAVTAATSPFETFGRSPAEALAVGLPLVAPAWGPLRDLLAGAAPGAAFAAPVAEASPPGSPARVDAAGLATAVVAALDAHAERPPRPDPAFLATHDPGARFGHAVATARATALAAHAPVDGALGLPAAWARLDAALGHPSPAALRAATFATLPATRELDAAREAIRADWFAGW